MAELRAILQELTPEERLLDGAGAKAEEAELVARGQASAEFALAEARARAEFEQLSKKAAGVVPARDTLGAYARCRAHSLCTSACNGAPLQTSGCAVRSECDRGGVRRV